MTSVDSSAAARSDPDRSKSGASLRRTVVGGVSWNLGSQIGIQAMGLAGSIVLARILSPHQFGIAAMAFVFSGIAIIISDLSLSAALVQRPTITETDRSTVFWTTLGIGIGCSMAGAASSPLVAGFFHQPEVAPLFAAVSGGFTLTALSATQSALLTRELRFKSLQLRAIAAAVIGNLVAIAVAVAGFGPWAVVSEGLAASAASTALLWSISSWRPRLVYSRQSLRELGSFGIKMFGSRLLAYANGNMDNLLVGRFLGSAALGAYALAFNVMIGPISSLTSPIQQVLFPALARIQDDRPRLLVAWKRAARLVTAVGAPAFLGLIVVAPDLVRVVYGAKWDAAVRILQLLSLAGLAQSGTTLNWPLLQASGRVGTLLRYNLVSGALNVTAFAVGLHWGVDGVAGLYAVSRALLFGPYLWITSRAVGASPLEMLRNLAGVFGAALGMFVGAYLFRLFLVAEQIGAATRLPLVVLFGIALFAACTRVTARDLIAEAASLVRRHRPEPVPSPSVG